MVEAQGVSKSFGDDRAVDSFDLTVTKGEVVGLIGPSGCGKSTLLRCLNTLEDIDEGNVIIEGEKVDYSNWAQKKAIRQKVQIIFQSFNLFPHLSVKRNITLGPIKVKNQPPEEAENRAKEILKQVGLLDKIDANPQELSGGQQQRVAIARSLAMDPAIILLDEITSSLDPELTADVLDLLRNIAKKGKTMIAVSHEIGFIRDVSSRIIFMENGSKIKEGTLEELLSDESNNRIANFLSRFLEDSTAHTSHKE